MNHKRNNRIQNSLWVILNLGLFLFAVVFDTPTAWIPVYFFTFIVIINALLLSQSSKDIQLESMDDIVLDYGDSLHFSLHISDPVKKRLFYPSIIAHVKLEGETLSSKGEAVFFKPSARLDFSLGKLERGIYEIEGLDIEASDFFGMFKRTLHHPLTLKIMVLPKHSHKEADVLFNYILNQSKIALSDSDLTSFDIKNIRSYHYGDRINLIDWKLSSKMQELIVKEYEDDKEDLVQFIFFGEDSKEFEPILSIFYSFYFHYLEGMGLPVLLISDDVSDTNPTLTSFANVRAIEDDVRLMGRLLTELEPNTRKFIFSTLPSVELESSLLNHEQFNNSMLFQMSIDGKITALFGGRVERVYTKELTL